MAKWDLILCRTVLLVTSIVDILADAPLKTEAKIRPQVKPAVEMAVCAQWILNFHRKVYFWLSNQLIVMLRHITFSAFSDDLGKRTFKV